MPVCKDRKRNILKGALEVSFERQRKAAFRERNFGVFFVLSTRLCPFVGQLFKSLCCRKISDSKHFYKALFLEKGGLIVSISSGRIQGLDSAEDQIAGY